MRLFAFLLIFWSAPVLGGIGDLGRFHVHQETVNTNQVDDPEDFSAGSWGGAAPASVSADTDDSPVGTLTADTLTDGDATLRFLQDTITVADDSAARTFSFHVRQTSGNTHFVAINMIYAGGSTKNVTGVLNTNTCSVTALAAGSVSFQVGSAIGYCLAVLAVANNGTGNTTLLARIYPAYNTDGSITAAAAATGGNAFWGAKLEDGSRYTRYKP